MLGKMKDAKTPHRHTTTPLMLLSHNHIMHARTSDKGQEVLNIEGAFLVAGSRHDDAGLVSFLFRLSVTFAPSLSLPQHAQ